ncbi:ferrous iron transport protein B [Mucilaginibacter sp.]|uniref:ferrous iron transport protein B n=1 Tax=Mucilaginibacter sp. TaxID=1882438 RepID=UPI000CAD6399|nr:ferrous iron transport protein B [Mucilaginibacter sp.]PLW88724.1 MAG: ferrous iron transport protein B [Mucilaginibacter sp.]PMP65673.1 MAG: ferrous iron transport protein B [Mucilaginibacter sp.]HEK18961.1 ferrous iron transport protein B [Bacteroidota bacterium]
MKIDLKVALIGNPNTGKSSLFNALTGMNQKVGNFPGVTVEKKTGFAKLPEGRTAQVIDLPGTYSLYPKSKDEAIVLEVLADTQNSGHPDLLIFIADASNLKRNLLLYTQVADLKIPVIIALNMMDMADREGIRINVDALAKKLGVRVIPISARKGKGIIELKQAMAEATSVPLQADTIDLDNLYPGLIARVKQDFIVSNPYLALQLVYQYPYIRYLTPVEISKLKQLENEYDINPSKAQAKETIARYEFINDVLYDTVQRDSKPSQENYSNRIDKVLTHKIGGFLIFILILFLIFQAIFTWANIPMDLISNFFIYLTNLLSDHLPPGPLTQLITNGVLPGLSGVLVFIPQIAILFIFISILEDTGYMARVTFMMDKIMRKVGLNGKSVIPIIGGLACAVPSIMSTRSIENWKDRIITILVTPLITCSARLPVYTLLISLVVPQRMLWGFISLQGIALMMMYLLGFFSAFIVAWVMKKIIKSGQRGYFIMELPVYQWPRWKNVGLTMLQKVKAFAFQAGKVIIAVSIILWVLASYAPPGRFAAIERYYQTQRSSKKVSMMESDRLLASAKLEASYAGILGKTIEPVIRPLGYDWKIGIALITSFAAREVFVGTMATIYSADGDAHHQEAILQKIKAAKNPDNGLPVFTTAVGFSLLIFYAFAMQCMSTMVVVYKETNALKWPVIQFIYMTGLAYLLSFGVYHLLK